MKYLFGPVNSRRLGLSLGIDLLPHKTCSLNCVYCECGATTNLTSDITEYVPTDEVIAELDEFLKSGPKLDAVTFSGSGEPTLHSGIGRIISYIKRNYPEYKICVLTNSTLLYRDEVRKSIIESDVIIPSLDAASGPVFKKIAGPERGASAEKSIEGIAALRREFTGTIILEIFIVPGLNDTESELDLIKAACLKIAPDRIELNTLDRPGTVKSLKPASPERLAWIKKYLEPLAVEITGSPGAAAPAGKRMPGNTADDIISIVSRRPSTIDDLAVALNTGADELKDVIRDLLEKGAIREEKQARGIFYRRS